MSREHDVPYDEKYQTPLSVVKIMCDMIPNGVNKILEPTPGSGNIVRELESRGYNVTAPSNFQDMNPFQFFDCVVMNPPFKSSIEHSYLLDAMRMSDTVIALMPWFTLINSDSRTEYLKQWGLVSVTHLPRATWRQIRVQPCILFLRRGHSGPTELLFVNKKTVRNNNA